LTPGYSNVRFNSVPPKTEHLQIRVTPQQKAALKRQARAAGCDVSSYVLSRLVPDDSAHFAALIETLRSAADPRYALAELNDFLHACPPLAFGGAIATADMRDLSPYLANYVAAMVEQAANTKQIAAPAWVKHVAPLESPRFATALPSLRMHLLQASPIPFKRRNIFIDASVGARV
jgi:hypothetical protein